MGKKKQLRHVVADKKVGSKRSLSAVSDKSKVNKKTKTSSSMENKVDEEDDEWDAIERSANKFDSSDDSDSDEDSEDEIKLQGTVEQSDDFTFEFNDMRDEYTTGIRTMLRVVISNPTEAYSVADLVTEQQIVGTVINCEGGDDAFGFATVLPLTKCVELPTYGKLFTQLRLCVDGLLSTQKKDEELRQFQTALSSSGSVGNTGLLIHQRFSNLPIQLIGPLHKNLEEDVEWARQQKDTSDSSNSSSSSSGESKGNFFASLKNIVLLCPVAAVEKTAFDLSGASAAHSVVGTAALNFDSFEDEVYFQHATAAVLFRTPKGCNTGLGDLVAVLLAADKVSSCVEGISALLPEA